MSWSLVGNYGGAQNKVSGNTLQIFQPGSAIAAGTIIVVTIAADNVQTSDGVSSLVQSVAGTYSDTFTKAYEYTNGEGSAAAGVTCSVWYRRVTSLIAAGFDTINITFASNVTAKCAFAYMFSNTGGVCNTAQTLGSVSDVDPDSMTISGLTSREYLFLRSVATERGNYGFSPTTNYTAFGQNTTTSPGDATDVAIGSEYRILTATGDTTDPVTGSPQSASVYIAFMDVVASENVAVTGVSATSAIGTAVSGVTVRPAVTGVSATSAIGTTTQSGKAGVSLSTMLANSALGAVTVAVNNSVTLTGFGMGGAIGAASVATTMIEVTGVSATGAVGTTVQTGQASLTLTGVSATGAVGAVVAAVPNDAVVTGFALTTGLGAVVVSAKANVPVVGVSATLSLGSAVAYIGTVAEPLPMAAMVGQFGDINSGQSNTRVNLDTLGLQGMRASLGDIGIRAWGLVDDTAPSTWNTIETE